MRGLVVSRKPGRVGVRTRRTEPGVAHLTSPSDGPLAVAHLGRRCDALVRSGYRLAVTEALDPYRQRPFLEAGFEVTEELLVLARPLAGPVPGPGWRLRRGTRADRPAALALDAAAFGPAWRLDTAGLREGLAATPTVRFRLTAGAIGVFPPCRARTPYLGGWRGKVRAAGATPAGYAISGCAGRLGYLQRLAVVPMAQGRGVGRALTLDALAWMGRRGASRALVNTHVDNERALRLYRRLGFELQPQRLAVLARRLDERRPAG